MNQAPTPDPSWKGLPPWLPFALLVIGPPVALVALIRSITANPLLLVLLIAVYEIIILFIRFAGKIWLQLEGPLVEHLAEWMKQYVQELTSHYHRQYCQHLVYEHQVFDVKGLTTRTAHDLELEQAFVDLRIDPKAAHQVSSNPLLVPDHLKDGSHSIWEYLSTSSSLANPHLVLLGAPGSGKTTLLKHVALILAQPRKYTSRHKHLRQKFPILLFLRDHAQAILNQPNFSLAEAVQSHIQRKWQQTVPVTWIKRHLDRGVCLILLDGLDEIADATTRRNVAEWVQQQLLSYGHNRFVLTSRPYGYRDNPLDGVTILEVQTFTVEQIEQFIQNWYLANELKSWGKEDHGVHLRAREGAEDLLRRLGQVPALLDLAINPLLLTMIATVHRYRSSLPGKRVALYAEICEVFLGKRLDARGVVQELSPAQKQQILQPLAYHLMCQGRRELSAAEAEQVIAPELALVDVQLSPAAFLLNIENTSGLLLERNPGQYGFAHKTFQEYLAAVHIKEKGLEQELISQVNDDWWHETIRLYCAQADATDLILACLAGTPPAVKVLTLAFECDEEKLKFQPQAQARLKTVLEEGIEDADPERRRITAEALLERRLRHMIHFSGEALIDTTLITCAEYQLFLDDYRTQGIWYQPDQWQTATLPKGQGLLPVLGVRYTDAEVFCDWLTKRSGGQWRYRLPEQKELVSQEERLTSILHMAPTTGYWTQHQSFKIQKPYPFEEVECRAIEVLLENDHVRTLSPSGERDLDLVLNRVRNLDLALTKAGAKTLNLVKALDLAKALDFAKILALATTNSLDLAEAFVRTRSHTLADPSSQNNLADSFGLAYARSLYFRGNILDLAPTNALEFARAEAVELSNTKVHDHDHNLIQSLILAFDLPLLLKNLRTENYFEHPSYAEALRCCIRYIATVLARSFYWYSSLKGTRSSPKRANSPSSGTSRSLEHVAEGYRDIALAFALLEERVAGQLPAWEGILLVKEPGELMRKLFRQD